MTRMALDRSNLFIKLMCCPSEEPHWDLSNWIRKLNFWGNQLSEIALTAFPYHCE